MSASDDLVLGWRPSDNPQPPYSEQRSRKTLPPSGYEIVKVPLPHLTHHTAIVGQSGSGKSTFVARLLEELLIKTDCRCIIFDPNADFRLLAAPLKKSSGPRVHVLPGDENFQRRWRKVKGKIYWGSRPPKDSSKWSKQVRLPWPTLPLKAMITEFPDTAETDELHFCHQFVTTIGRLLAFKYLDYGKALAEEADLLTWVKKTLEDAKSGERKTTIQSRLKALLGNRTNYTEIRIKSPFLRRKIRMDKSRKEYFAEAVACFERFKEAAGDRYILRADRYESYGFLETGINEWVDRKGSYRENRLRFACIDLPTFPVAEARLAAVGAALELIWQNALLEWSDAMGRNGHLEAPTFLIVEEAHNLMPAEKDNSLVETVRESFRRIAAEGRKYGLYLIVCTQRLDKLDKFVVSECENVAIMKLGSQTVLDEVGKVFGLKSIPDKVLQFRRGNVLLMGQWAQKPLIFSSGTRRTEESSKKLPDAWLEPADSGR